MEIQKKKVDPWFWASIAADALLIITILIFGPIESYIGGQKDIGFSLGMVVAVFGIISLIAGAMLVFLSWLTRGKVRKIYAAFIFSLGLAFYLQANFLNADYGILDGRQIDWSQYGSFGLVNSIIWVLIVALPIALTLWKTKWMQAVIRYGAMILSAMQILTLCVLLMTGQGGKSTNDAKILTRDDLYTVGSEKNVIVLCVDTFDGEFIEYFLNHEPSYLSFLEGFTFFRNCVETYPKTQCSVPYMLSGTLNTNQMPLKQYASEVYQQSEFLGELRDNGYHMGIYTDIDTAEIAEIAANSSNQENKPTSYFEFAAKLQKYVLFRYAPHELKRHFWLYTGDFAKLIAQSDDTTAYITDNKLFYDSLLDHGVTVKPREEKAYRFIHLFGCHEPYTINEKVEAIDASVGDSIRQCKGVLQILQTYFEELKKLGCYESSTIMILGDHGGTIATQPALLVKPAGSVSGFEISDAPISYEDVHNTLLSSEGLPAVPYGFNAFEVPLDSKRTRILYMYDIGATPEEGYIPPMWELAYGPKDYEFNVTQRVYDPGRMIQAEDIAPTLKLDTVIPKKDLSKYFSVGFLSWGNEDFIWTNGQNGLLYMKIEGEIPPNGVSVHLQFAEWLPSPQRLIVTAQDGQVLFERAYQSGGDKGADIVVPREYINENNYLSLHFSCPDANRGLAKGTTTDPRMTSFAIKTMSVSRNP